MIKTLKNSTALVGFSFPRAFENEKTGWKLDTDGKPVLKDGNPVYIDGSGRELTVEAGTIARLQYEAKTHREAKEAAELKLKPYEGLDAEKAKAAIDTVSKFNAKQLIDAGEVEKVRDEISKNYTTQLTEKEKAITELGARIQSMTMQNAFQGSKFVTERVAVPPEMFQATFGRNFRFESDKLIPYGADGNKIYSKKRVGEIADFDEALEIIMESYPNKDKVLKAPDNSGSGNNGGGGNRGGGRTMSRNDFDKLDPMQKSQVAAAINKGEMQVVD